MKFIDLKKSNINRSETFKKFEEELIKFKLKYNTLINGGFDLTYYDTDTLVIVTDNPSDYNESIHDDLCTTFDVRLHSVQKSHLQSPLGHSDKIEWFYSPVHHYTTYLKWEDIQL